VVSVEDLTWAVGELAEMSTQDFEIDDLLRRLCEVADRSLPVDGVGVMKLDTDAVTRFVHASDPPLAGLATLQDVLQEGPSYDAMDTGETIAAASIDQMRWPAFEKAAAAVGIHAVLSVPLLSRGRTWGSLDLYWRAEHQPTDADRAAAQLLANVVVSYLAMAEDRVRTREAQQLLAHQLLHDQLTGLPNRALIEELIDHALAAAGRRDAQVAVLFIDIDGFKLINDTHGHQAGDRVLQVLASRMQTVIRAGDTVGRISGDEFIVTCEDIPQHEDAAEVLTQVAKRLRAAIAQPIDLRQPGLAETIEVTGSIGIAITAGHPTAAALIHAADVAMYQAKASTGIVATNLNAT
jgi:diguanylate cyclase (GGDEF)-like protein